jgi:hypothetical protein
MVAWPWRVRHRVWMWPVVVKLIRFYSGKGKPLDEGDNLESGFKAVRDQVAKELGVDDGDQARVRFECSQERAPKWGIRIEVQELGHTAESCDDPTCRAHWRAKP